MQGIGQTFADLDTFQFASNWSRLRPPLFADGRFPTSGWLRENESTISGVETRNDLRKSRPQAGAAASIATGADVAEPLRPATRHLKRGAVATAIEDAR
jgi:hypothetical protein